MKSKNFGFDERKNFKVNNFFHLKCGVNNKSDC